MFNVLWERIVSAKSLFSASVSVSASVSSFFHVVLLNSESLMSCSTAVPATAFIRL